MKHIGIIGHRSWIAVALADRVWNEKIGHVRLLPKETAHKLDQSDLSCTFIIPGKLEQTPEEMVSEMMLVANHAVSTNTCRKQVLLSSMSFEDGATTEYGRHKMLVETSFREFSAARRLVDPGFISLVVRAPAIFGPNQPLSSRMLIPSLVRGSVELKNPHKDTEFVHIDQLTKWLVGLIDETPQWDPLYVPSSFSLTPSEVRDLFLTFKSLSAGGRADDA